MTDEAVHDESAVVAEREYDASVDLHDSYYAAVAELRQQHEAGLPADPRNIKLRQIGYDAVIQGAALLKDWPKLHEAIDEKIGEQRDFVRWWRETVQANNRPLTVAVSATVSVDRAFELSGIRKDTASRWRKRLTDEAKYHLQLYLAACRKAGIEPEENHRAQGTGENEWFTPEQYIEAAREVMGEIDLDPASHPIAQETVRAQRYFTAADDGLCRQWWGRVWLNPPYAQPQIAQFVAKMVAEISLLGETKTVTEAIMLTHNYTDTAWFHQAEATADLICFTRGRIKFLDIDGDDCAPTQGQAFFYYGPNGDRFRDVFSQFGFVR